MCPHLLCGCKHFVGIIELMFRHDCSFPSEDTITILLKLLRMSKESDRFLGFSSTFFQTRDLKVQKMADLLQSYQTAT
jgi:hypothetical protein